MASAALGPLKLTPGQLFVKSHFHTKPIPPPASTDLTGKTAIITGSNTGIGYEAAKVLLEYNLSHLIIAVRTVSKGEAAALELRKTNSKAKIEVWHLDMLDYQSIQDFARKCNGLSRLDIALLNAGVQNMKWHINPKTGHEETFQVNYLSTALLALLLLPVFKAKKVGDRPGIITLVASALGMQSKFPNRNAVPLLPSFDEEQKFNIAAATERYNVSKTLVLMVVEKLGQIIDADDVIVNAAEPGFTGSTGLARHVPLYLRPVLYLMTAVAARSQQGAAWAEVHAAAVVSKESHGSFVMNWDFYPYHAMQYEEDGRKVTERLWEETLDEFKFAGVREIVSSMSRKV